MKRGQLVYAVSPHGSDDLDGLVEENYTLGSPTHYIDMVLLFRRGKPAANRLISWSYRGCSHGGFNYSRSSPSSLLVVQRRSNIPQVLFQVVASALVSHKWDTDFQDLGASVTTALIMDKPPFE